MMQWTALQEVYKQLSMTCAGGSYPIVSASVGGV